MGRREQIINFLKSNGGLTVKQISEELKTQRFYVYNILNHLEALGKVRREWKKELKSFVWYLNE